MMVYLVRYKEAGQDEEAQAVVEANTPTEAMVKLRHVCSAGGNSRVQRIVSVMQDQETDLENW